jgi:hypothetical protein
LDSSACLLLLSGANLIARLRQAPGFAPVAAHPAEVIATNVPAAVSAAPTIPPIAIDPAAAVPVDLLAAPAWRSSAVLAAAILPAPADQAVPPAPPAASLPPIPATTMIPGIPPQLTGDEFVTVQWIETHIGTLRTWVPQTETFHFKAMTQAPLPGVGSIGMGTLTEKTGQTQTI